MLPLCATAWPAEPIPAEEEARALVNAMQADKLVIAGINFALNTPENREKLPQSVRDCVAGLDYSFARELYVQVVQDALTPAEISGALDYYRSRAGHMNMMVALRENREQLANYPGLAEAEAAGDPTKEEWQQIVAFAQSPLGQKIGQIHSDPRVEKLSDAIAERMMAECFPKP